MLFFFEFAFFLVAVITVAIAERAGLGQALVFASVVTILSLAARQLVAGRVPLPAGRDKRELREAPEEARWWRATLDSWQHLNRALLIGWAGLALAAGLARWLSG